MVSGGGGLTVKDSNDSFTLNIDGTAVAAYLFWSGRYVGAGNGDDTIKIAINSDPAVSITASDDREAFSGWDGRNHYTYRSDNLVNGALAGKLSGTINVTVSDLKSEGDESNQGHGIGLIVIYEDSDCPESKIELFYGLDGFHERFTAPFGPNSEVLCIDIPAASDPRTLEIQLFAGGAEGNRPNAVWVQTGTGTKPTTLVDNGTATEIDAVQPALKANVGPEWDDYKRSITIPALATYACFQIESVATAPAAAKSAPSIDGNLDIAPYGTSGVWVSMASRLLPVGVVPPTPTATGTPGVGTPTATGTPGVGTPTATGTPGVGTPTATGTPGVGTPTATGTPGVGTPTATPTTVGPTPTPTTVVQCTPTLIFGITSRPSPAHPGQQLTFIITFQSTNNCPIHGLKFKTNVPAFTTFFSGNAQNAQQTDNASWQCESPTDGSACAFTVGDLTPFQNGTVEFPVTVQDSAALGTKINLNVVAVDNDGNTQNGGTAVEHEVVVEAFNLLFPLINNNSNR